MLTVNKEKWSYSDYLLLDDDHRYEIIGGHLEMTPAPSVNHQVISKRLFIRLNSFVEDNALGTMLYAPVDVVLSDEDVFEPDILFISRHNSHIIEDNAVFGPPDLVIEILSLSTQYRDLHEKRMMYQRYKVREYWIVDPFNRHVEILILNDKGSYITHANSEQYISSNELKGLEVDLDDIFKGWL
ncbi:MAG: Uma2 family endonuclease [Nitrospirae bacterium]|nr:Uma2 family endonuclease [Nitrospirota bacterium]